MTWSREPWALPRPAESPKGFPGDGQVRGGEAAGALTGSTGRVSRLWNCVGRAPLKRRRG